MKAVNTARMNIRAAGLTKDITVEQLDFADFKQPSEEAIIITNPPYGERISTPNLLATYKMIGEKLKHEFQGNNAWILSYREECFEQIGLRPSIKIPVFNGSLECEFRKYQMFQGKLREYRSEGNILKTEEEKQAMAEKHRFKKNREFKKRIDEDEANETGDIRSFVFHKHHPAFDERMFERKEERSFRRSRDDGDDGEGRSGRFGGGQERRSFKGKGGFNGKRDFRDNRGPRDDFKGKGGKRFDKTGGKNFKKNNKRYDD
jgi:putative N6-adenine-specific DNA methylase